MLYINSPCWVGVGASAKKKKKKKGVRGLRVINERKKVWSRPP